MCPLSVFAQWYEQKPKYFLWQFVRARLECHYALTNSASLFGVSFKHGLCLFLRMHLSFTGLHLSGTLCIVLLSEHNSSPWPLKLLSLNTHFLHPTPIFPQQTLSHAPQGPPNVKRQTPYPHIYSPMTPQDHNRNHILSFVAGLSSFSAARAPEITCEEYCVAKNRVFCSDQVTKNW